MKRRDCRPADRCGRVAFQPAPRPIDEVTCEPALRCRSCGAILPEPPPAASNWGDWRCLACDAPHCQDRCDPNDTPCGALLDEDDRCPTATLESYYDSLELEARS